MTNTKHTPLHCLVPLLAVLLSACDSVEPPRSIEYFEGLGYEKSSEYLSSCTDQKKALIEKNDAEGLDKFAKSTRSPNCRHAIQYVLKQDAKQLMERAKDFKGVGSVNEVKNMLDKINGETNAKIKALDVFTDWIKEDGKEIAYAHWVVNNSAQSVITRLQISQIGR